MENMSRTPVQYETPEEMVAPVEAVGVQTTDGGHNEDTTVLATETADTGNDMAENASSQQAQQGGKHRARHAAPKNRPLRDKVLTLAVDAKIKIGEIAQNRQESIERRVGDLRNNPTFWKRVKVVGSAATAAALTTPGLIIATKAAGFSGHEVAGSALDIFNGLSGHTGGTTAHTAGMEIGHVMPVGGAGNPGHATSGEDLAQLAEKAGESIQSHPADGNNVQQLQHVLNESSGANEHIGNYVPGTGVEDGTGDSGTVYHQEMERLRNAGYNLTNPHAKNYVPQDLRDQLVAQRLHDLHMTGAQAEGLSSSYTDPSETNGDIAKFMATHTENGQVIMPSPDSDLGKALMAANGGKMPTSAEEATKLLNGQPATVNTQPNSGSTPSFERHAPSPHNGANPNPAPAHKHAKPNHGGKPGIENAGVDISVVGGLGLLGGALYTDYRRHRRGERPSGDHGNTSGEHDDSDTVEVPIASAQGNENENQTPPSVTVDPNNDRQPVAQSRRKRSRLRSRLLPKKSGSHRLSNTPSSSEPAEQQAQAPEPEVQPSLAPANPQQHKGLRTPKQYFEFAHHPDTKPQDRGPIASILWGVGPSERRRYRAEKERLAQAQSTAATPVQAVAPAQPQQQATPSPEAEELKEGYWFYDPHIYNGENSLQPPLNREDPSPSSYYSPHYTEPEEIASALTSGERLSTRWFEGEDDDHGLPQGNKPRLDRRRIE